MIAIFSQDAWERELPNVGALSLLDPESGAGLLLDTSQNGVRTAYREPTAILRAAGVPPVRRDEFEERTLPDDRYGLAVRSLGDLGDEDLAPLLLAWGIGKATVVRARRAAPRATGRPGPPPGRPFQ